MRSSDGTVHIIGAGMAGLAAAVRLAGSGRAVAVHEAALLPGGRCRSYYDHAAGMLIDNGTHILMSANHAALAYAMPVEPTVHRDPEGVGRRPRRGERLAGHRVVGLTSGRHVIPEPRVEQAAVGIGLDRGFVLVHC